MRVRKAGAPRPALGRAQAERETAPYVERLFWSAGLARVAGVDEVGMGPLAGPVVAAAVVFAPATEPLRGIADSKLLPAAAREEAAAAISKAAMGIGIGLVEAAEIDRLNIYRAGLEAMRRAVAALPFAPDHLLVDARRIPDVDVPQTQYVHADAIVYSVAAASIVAKVHRDGLMCAVDRLYPAYGFARHVGYATPEHLRALAELGPTPLHRRSFAPCAAAAARTGA
ncbi:MAG: ribonuclease HII [Polyangiaceae bacterium UTPRO1]|jgi:ribonuclease HII|nr:ribonuclease HII [Myxococcales bacterium]OQY66390.1 MAG: ribonuclease HII [Polyangiaceae bacterium UTPRO1]